MNDLINSFGKALYYNGYEEFFNEIRKETHYRKNITCKIVDEYVINILPYCYTEHYIHKTYEYGQVELIWSVLVLMFGEYGTSPRTGWIEKKKFPELIKFIESLEESIYE